LLERYTQGILRLMMCVTGDVLHKLLHGRLLEEDAVERMVSDLDWITMDQQSPLSDRVVKRRTLGKKEDETTPRIMETRERDGTESRDGYKQSSQKLDSAGGPHGNEYDEGHLSGQVARRSSSHEVRDTIVVAGVGPASEANDYPSEMEEGSEEDVVLTSIENADEEILHEADDGDEDRGDGSERERCQEGGRGGRLFRARSGQ
jgi:hypothetical protein